MRHIASVSFGKDSLAMLLLLLEKEMPLDEVIFYNSGMEFQAIYDIRDRIRPILEQRGIRFTEVKPDAPFLYQMLERPVFSKKNGYHLGYGWCGGPSRWGTRLKMDALDGLGLDAEKHYCRTSTNQEEQNSSLENQIAYYTAFIQSNPKWRFVAVCADQASGLHTKNRPGYRKLLRGCRRKKIDLILVKSLSRFGRDAREAISTIRKLK